MVWERREADDDYVAFSVFRVLAQGCCSGRSREGYLASPYVGDTKGPPLLMYGELRYLHTEREGRFGRTLCRSDEEGGIDDRFGLGAEFDAGQAGGCSRTLPGRCLSPRRAGATWRLASRSDDSVGP